MCLAGLALVMLSISTILFLPRSYITKRNIRRKSCEIEDIKGLEYDVFCLDFFGKFYSIVQSVPEIIVTCSLQKYYISDDPKF